MSTPEPSGTPDRPEPDGLTAAWLGLEELGPQPGFSAMIDVLRTLADDVGMHRHGLFSTIIAL